VANEESQLKFRSQTSDNRRQVQKSGFKIRKKEITDISGVKYVFGHVCLYVRHHPGCCGGCGRASVTFGTGYAPTDKFSGAGAGNTGSKRAGM